MSYLWKPQAFRRTVDRKVDGGPEEHTLTSGGTVSETPKLSEHSMCKYRLRLGLISLLYREE